MLHGTQGLDKECNDKVEGNYAPFEGFFIPISDCLQSS
jgi:hypothetical protein